MDDHRMPHVRIKWLNWVAVLSPTGDLLGGEETEELNRTIKEALGKGYQGVVLNLKEVGFVNTIAYGVIIAGHSWGLGVGARMALCCVNERNPLQKHGIPLPVFETEEEAIRFCASR